jgi:hypothetical protein
MKKRSWRTLSEVISAKQKRELRRPIVTVLAYLCYYIREPFLQLIKWTPKVS